MSIVKHSDKGTGLEAHIGPIEIGVGWEYRTLMVMDIDGATMLDPELAHLEEPVLDRIRRWWSDTWGTVQRADSAPLASGTIWSWCGRIPCTRRTIYVLRHDSTSHRLS